jgi:DNA-directed RNA polymerase subunit RPC12/RpoP
MRPGDTDNGEQIYECFECGRRATQQENRKCPRCSGELRHLGRPRDL